MGNSAESNSHLDGRMSKKVSAALLLLLPAEELKHRISSRFIWLPACSSLGIHNVDLAKQTVLSSPQVSPQRGVTTDELLFATGSPTICSVGVFDIRRNLVQ